MPENKTERQVMFAPIFLMVLFAGVALFVSLTARVHASPNSAASRIATFRTKCAMCHGPDGRGSAVGDRMNVPDLRSPYVQNLTDAQLRQIITDGKGGMPSFRNSLSEDQIQELVAYIRLLHHAAPLLRGREGTL